MILSFYNENLNLEGMVSEFISLLWHRKFFQVGNFTLVAPKTDFNEKYILQHKMFTKPNGAEIAYITNIIIEFDEKMGEIITASGFFISSLLSYRIIYDAETGDGFYDVIDKQIGEMCADSKRRIEKLKVDRSVYVESEYNLGFRFSNLGEYVENICRREKCGITVSLVTGSNTHLRLSVKYGVDRSASQSENPKIIFSAENENLIWLNYQYSDNGAVNAIYGYAIAADSVTGIRPEFLHDGEHAGFERMETAVEVNAVTASIYREVVTDWTEEGFPIFGEQRIEVVDINKTMEFLKIETANNVREPSESYEGGVYFEDGYKTEYDLGDIVTVGKTDKRIVEVSEFYDVSGMRVEPIFGDPARTIEEFIKVR
ncbi:MAG: siphovirus ReqiPepy6 Gp37-like family protein [Oscillospiraceae bacterium]|nr:siphovirus ReqiPepy6 Gp37-like family protein [Oscillospiraceae bacterium]